MPQRLTPLGDGFHRVAGHFRLGPVDLGTHCSLARLDDGGWVMLDSYPLEDAVLAEVRALTGGDLRAIINVHPFHTLHCAWAHRAFPQAVLYGTARHHRQLPDLPWDPHRCEDGVLATRFGSSLAFSQPDGVPLVCADESVHFSSILVLHRASGTIHVDDTLTYLVKGFPLSLLPTVGRVDFHPTLAKGLKAEAGAADAFRDWAIGLGTDWADARRIAAAHNAVRELAPGEFPEVIGAALGRVKPVLDAHRARHG